MTKLYFRYGTVGSSKTARMLMDAYNDVQHGRSILMLKIAMDTRWDATRIISRVPGLNWTADALIEFPGDIIRAIRGCKTPPSHIYCDEIQFATRDVVEMFREVTRSGIAVICTGIISDWKLNLFEGSSAMLSLADQFYEVKSMCSAWDKQCKRKSLVNLKHMNKTPVKEGPSIEMGGDEAYIGVCFEHYCEFTDQ